MKVFCCDGWKLPSSSTSRSSGAVSVASQPCPKLRLGPRDGVADRTEGAQRRVPAVGAQAHDHAQGPLHERYLTLQPGRAGVALGHGRLVVRGCAPDRRGHARLDEPLAISGMVGGRQCGQADAVQRGEQPVAGAVPGEDSPGAVAAVGRRREADDEHTRGGRAPARDRAPPVGLRRVRRALVGRDPLAPLDEPVAGAAHRHRGLEVGQVARRGKPANVVGCRGHRGVRPRRVVRPPRARRHGRGEGGAGDRVRQVHEVIVTQSSGSE